MAGEWSRTCHSQDTVWLVSGSQSGHCMAGEWPRTCHSQDTVWLAKDLPQPGRCMAAEWSRTCHGQDAVWLVSGPGPATARTLYGW